MRGNLIIELRRRYNKMVNSKLTKSLRNSIAAEAKKVGANSASKTSKAAVKKLANTTTKTLKKRPTAKTTTTRRTAAHPAPNHAAASAAHKTKTFFELPDNQMIGLAHNKLHHLVETNYYLCETCLENLQKVNNNLHDYLNQLVEINNVSSLIKLNLTYLSTAPTRYQEMIAQNKNIFSNFFKFAKVQE
jgi:hypothetical protein